MGSVLRVGARHDHKMGVLETVQVGKHLVERLSKAHIRCGKVGACEGERDALVLRQPELLATCGFVVFLAKRGAGGNPGDRDTLLGDLARAQGLGHRLVRDAEQIAVKVRPQAFRLVVGGDAYDGEGLPGDHPRTDSDVCGRDVRADDGEGRNLAHMLGETGEHDARPGGAACPQKAPCQGIAPGEVVDGTRRAGEHRRHLVAVHAHAAEVEHVEHFDIQVFGAGDVIAKGGVVAQKFERLRDGVRRAAMARADRGMHHDDRRARCVAGGGAGRLALGGVIGSSGRFALGRAACGNGCLALGRAACGYILHFTGEFHGSHAI